MTMIVKIEVEVIIPEERIDIAPANRVCTRNVQGRGLEGKRRREWGNASPKWNKPGMIPEETGHLLPGHPPARPVIAFEFSFETVFHLWRIKRLLKRLHDGFSLLHRFPFDKFIVFGIRYRNRLLINVLAIHPLYYFSHILSVLRGSLCTETGYDHLRDTNDAFLKRV